MSDTGTPNAYKPVSKLATAEDLSNLLDSLKRGRMRREIEWRLNLAYYRGDQYVYWNPAAKRVDRVPTEDGEKPRYLVRMVNNQITSGTQSLMAKIIKSKPMFGATPAQPGDQAVKAAEFCEMLLEGWWTEMGLAEKYEEAVLWSIHAGTGYWKITWDPYANKAMRFLLDPQGQPITDEGVAQQFRAALEQNGIEPQETVVYLGDIKVEVMSPFHVWGDPTAKSVDEWKWYICQHNLSPDEVKYRYGVDLQPDATTAQPDQTLPMGNAEGGAANNVVKTYVGYFLPTPALPNGRYVVWSESGGKKILHDDKWPWPELTRPNLVAFQGIKVPGTADGDALTSHARPLQKQLNRMLSQVTEYFALTVKPRLWAPVNSLKQRLTTEPGAAYVYNPFVAGSTVLKPEIEQLASIPPYVFTFLDGISASLREVYGLTEVGQGQLPPNLEAADAIDLLQEMASDRFAPAIMANERSLANAGQVMLALAQTYYEEPRQLQIRGFGSTGAVKAFTKADIAGGVTIHVEAGSSLPKTKAARRQQIDKWIEMGLINPRKAYRYYDIADIKDIAVDFAQDEDHALREHDKIIKGIPLNPDSLQSAMAALQQGINPETGQPLGPEDNPQEILLKASLQPLLAEDLDAHLDKHRKLIVSQEFDSYDPQIQHRFNLHYQLTYDRKLSIPVLPEKVDSPRVSLQIRGAAGPTETANILRRAGVPEADPHTLATEPPMETMVMDSVDQPDADATGPGEEANHLSQAAATMMQADVANATAQVQNATHVDKHVQSAQQADELHQHQVRKAKAEADLAEKKAKESSFKPQPKAKPSPAKK
jgi:hypothetical protein